jgi:protein associated with RNAse G/E
MISFATVTQITIRLLKPFKNRVITYQGEVLSRDERHVLLRAIWTWPREELGYVAFEPGDHFYEHFYADRWYNVFAISSAEAGPKGWYCNITRPALLGSDVIESEDLELDLFVPPDRQGLLVLDEDEFAARDLLANDPAAHYAALAALEELQRLATRGHPPFDEGGARWMRQL